MPNRFAKQMLRGGGRNLTRQFGETIVYYPRDGSDGRPVQAKVSRNTLEIIQETGDITSQALVVMVENDSCRGISSDEIDTGGDEIAVALRDGLPTQRRAIARVLGDHAGLLRILIQ